MVFSLYSPFSPNTRTPPRSALSAPSAQGSISPRPLTRVPGSTGSLGRRVKLSKNTLIHLTHWVRKGGRGPGTPLAPHPTESVRAKEVKPWLYPAVISPRAIIWGKLSRGVDQEREGLFFKVDMFHVSLRRG